MEENQAEMPKTGNEAMLSLQAGVRLCSMVHSSDVDESSHDLCREVSVTDMLLIDG